MSLDIHFSKLSWSSPRINHFSKESKEFFFLDNGIKNQDLGTGYNLYFYFVEIGRIQENSQT